ncbi:TetR/AcrR family transcriptional regulator [Motiliproteus sediminis]|uniref:TetR/AcrR family transcriptional regulator n=1 Tax=Motiliproteus sediminis TaxID=1468178 RepID=UPI001AEFDBAA|nr:TetR/AcrR family transcriptional regulator [Motiliproteus sediminis]
MAQGNQPSCDTRTRIMQASLRLLNKQGYHATGLSQILADAQVPKGSFYHYFDSKEQLAIELIQHYQNLLLERWRAMVDLNGPDCLAQLKRGLQSIVTDYNERPNEQLGCLLASLSGELAFASPFLRGAVQNAIAGICDQIEQDLSHAQRQGQVRDDIAASTLAQLFWCSWQGATLRMKITRSTAPLQEVGALLLDHLYRPLPSQAH